MPSPGNSRLASSRADQIRFLVESLALTPQAIRVRVETPEGQLLHSVDIPAEGGVTHAVIPPAEPHAPEQAPAPQRPRKRRRNTRLRGLLLDILDDAEKRLTGPEIFDLLSKQPGYEGWAWKTVEGVLLSLAHDGLIDNATDELGSGYALL